MLTFLIPGGSYMVCTRSEQYVMYYPNRTRNKRGFGEYYNIINTCTRLRIIVINIMFHRDNITVYSCSHNHTSYHNSD